MELMVGMRDPHVMISEYLRFWRLERSTWSCTYSACECLMVDG